MFYNFDKLISYHALLNFVIGERGVGKSFNAKILAIKDFIKNGKQFVYLRRYQEELELACGDFFSDIQKAGYFKDDEFDVVKEDKLVKFLMNNEVIGFGCALSKSGILKSRAFPDVRTIIFDEFIIDEDGFHRYIKNEVSKMLDICETIFRLRDDGRVLFLANAITIDNPYFNYFDLNLPYNSEFKLYKDGLILVNYIKNLEYRAQKTKTRFGKLIAGTSYGNYAIDNKMLRDDDNFIEKKGQNPHFWHTLYINNSKFGIWIQPSLNRLYISEDLDPSSKFSYAVEFDDFTPDTKFISAKQNPYMKIILNYYKNGDLRFENIKVKNACMKLIKKCLSF